jgi:flagellar biosynthesis protein FlhF
MVIKKFLGKTESDAIEAAKKELGEGIVIMNVREVKKKGIFASFQKKQVEVTVALEEEGEQKLQIKKDIMEAVQSVKNIAEASDRAKEGAYPKTTGTELSQGIKNSDNIERKLDSLQTLLENQLNKGKNAAENFQTVLNAAGGGDEAAAAKEDAEKSAKAKENDEQQKFYELLYDTMIENEVDEVYARQIIDETCKNTKPNIPFDYILASVYQKMVLKFGKANGIQPAQNGPKAVFFIGPTGVGKTTTIAKIASSFVVDDKKKVALITTDTYRIAAAEQLHTYANILEVPFKVVYTAEELAQTIVDFKEYDYIFIDTMGHSQKNEDQLDKVKEFIDSARSIVEYDIFLVMSATTKYKDLLKIAESYGEVTKYQLIFTKLDETDTLGNLLNVKLHMDTPIAYVTHGQNVPSDIECFNPQKTVKQILGGKYE